jgi:pimeloyl-ACP methyl ester carboxylesterase
VTLGQTQYARSGDADIAYRVSGNGPPDVVLVYDWGSHIEAVAEQPLFDEFLQSLGRFSRVIWFDMQGIGMSRSFVGGVMPVESWVDDLAAVMDAVGSTEATVVAQG